MQTGLTKHVQCFSLQIAEAPVDMCLRRRELPATQVVASPLEQKMVEAILGCIPAATNPKEGISQGGEGGRGICIFSVPSIKLAVAGIDLFHTHHPLLGPLFCASRLQSTQWKGH